MSQDQHTGQSEKPASGNLIAAILIFNLIVILVILGASTVSSPPELVEYGGTVIGWSSTQTATYEPSATFTATLVPTVTPTVMATTVPTAAPLDPQRVAAGERTFQSVCAACHGFNAQGVNGLGPSMIGNTFINAQSNEDLLAFVIVGRPSDHPDNTSGIAMPARGGNPTVTDENLMDVIQYIRSLNPGVVVPVSSAGGTDDMSTAATPEQPSEVATEVAEPVEPAEEIVFAPIDLTGITSARDDEESEEEDPFFSKSERTYAVSCSGCHGPQGEGVAMFGPALAGSPLLSERNGIGLLEMLTLAQPPADPAAGFVHPYRGGYPALTDEEIMGLLGYLYTLPGVQP
jgi:disulfide bond formation protein DsbB